MNKSDLVDQRLHNQKLSSSDLKKPVDVVRWLGAVQAQDFGAAKWALALRMPEATDAVIEEGFNQGKILRTHLMRPTWHFVAPDDIRWLLQLTAPRVNARCSGTYRKYELDAATLKRSNKVLSKALQGGKYLSRRVLKAVLNESGVAADDTVRFAYILLRAELDQVICSGPRVDKQFTYALFDERVPATKALDREESLARLTRRYFTSHGPATLQDFVWWSGLTVADARLGLALVDRDLRQVLIEERVYWAPRSVHKKQRSRYSAHLLPVYDEYFVAYKDRQAVIDPSDSKPTTWGLLGPAIVIDGIVAGSWKIAGNKNSRLIELALTKTLDKSETLSITKAANRYAAFLDRDGLLATIR